LICCYSFSSDCVFSSPPQLNIQFFFFLNPEIGFLTGGGARGGAEEEKEEKEQEEEVGLFSIHLHYTITM